MNINGRTGFVFFDEYNSEINIVALTPEQIRFLDWLSNNDYLRDSVDFRKTETDMELI